MSFGQICKADSWAEEMVMSRTTYSFIMYSFEAIILYFTEFC